MFARRFLRDRRGAVTMIVAASSMIILGLAAAAIDLGSVFLKARQLQGIADLSALAAAGDINNAQAAATATAQANGWTGPLTVQVVTGGYSADPTKTASTRFTAGGASPNAVKVTLNGSADLFFAQAILGQSSLPISRTATAASAQLAAFSLGSTLASLNGGVANSLLSSLTGSQVNLTVMDYNALAAANVDLFSYSQALATQAHLSAASFNQALAANVTTGQALTVFANLLNQQGNSSGAAAVSKLATAAGNTTQANLGQLIDLGPYGAQTYSAGGNAASISINALDLTNAMLTLSQGGRQVQLSLGATVPGLTSTTAWLAIGQRPTNTPWLTVAADGSEIIQTVQTRIYVDSKLAPGGLLGLAQVDLPVLVEVAGAKAKLSSIDCSTGSATLSASPSLGDLTIGQINTTNLNDFTQPLSVSAANFVTVGPVALTGLATTSVGGNDWQTVSFSSADIAAGTIKSIDTTNIAQETVGSLLGNLAITASIGGISLGLGPSPLQTAVANALSGAAAPVDGVINSLTALLGVHLGEADVRVDGVRCHDAALVA